MLDNFVDVFSSNSKDPFWKSMFLLVQYLCLVPAPTLVWGHRGRRHVMVGVAAPCSTRNFNDVVWRALDSER